jgi:L-serine dehydratase
MAVSVFDLFKIGIGPSSSHTVGPMRAARLFAQRLANDGLIDRVAAVRAELYGSLGATGKGHGSDKAVLLGLEGEEPATVEVDTIPARLAAIREARQLRLLGGHPVRFVEKEHLLFFTKALPFHANGLRFSGLDAEGRELAARTYYSVGGGFVVSEELASDGTAQKRIAPDTTILPLPFHTGDELLAQCTARGVSIAQVMRANERHWRDDDAVDAGLLAIWHVMQRCVERGLRSEGTLPGGLKVRRRAAEWHRKLVAASGPTDPLAVLDWVNLFALAVNEENAAGGRVVTAPTNGAAGIIPAVLHSTRRTRRSRAPRWAARARWAWRARWPRAGWRPCSAARRSRWRTPPRSAWSTTWGSPATRSADWCRSRASSATPSRQCRRSTRPAWRSPATATTSCRSTR